MIIKKHLLLTKKQSKQFVIKLIGTDLHTDVGGSARSCVASSTGFKYFILNVGYFSI